MNNIWFFGDSFCHPCQPEYEKFWWGNYITEKLGQDKILKSKGGASIQDTMINLQQNKNAIQSGDTVFIAYTSPYRSYFDGKSVVMNNEGEFANPQFFTQGELNALKMFYAHLFAFDDYLNLFTWIVQNIQQLIIPQLQERGVKVNHFYSIEKPDVDIDQSLIVADEWIINLAEQKGFTPEPILQTPGHFGNDIVGDLNKDWSDLWVN